MNNYLPNELIDLPKQGFGIPLGDWINSSLNEWIIDNINTIKRKKQNFININVLLNNLKIHKENNIDLSSKLWPAIIFVIGIIKIFNDNLHYFILLTFIY